MPIPVDGLAEATKRAYAGNTLKPSRCVLQQLRLEGKAGLARGIQNAVMMATTLLSLQALELGKPYNQYMAARSARHNAVHFARTWNLTEQLEIPAALYLRASVSMGQGVVFPHMLYGDGSVKRFEWWLDRHFQRYYQETEAVDRLVKMSQNPDIVASLLRDIKRGEAHLDKVAVRGAESDRDVLAWLEQAALPGAYLLTLQSMRDAYCAKELIPAVSKRVERALTLMECPGVVEGLIEQGGMLQ